MKSYESKLEKPILEHGWVTHARKMKKDKRRNGGGIEWNRNGRGGFCKRGAREGEKERERDERFRDNRQDVRRVTIANHNGDRKTRMTG